MSRTLKVKYRSRWDIGSRNLCIVPRRRDAARRTVTKKTCQWSNKAGHRNDAGMNAEKQIASAALRGRRGTKLKGEDENGKNENGTNRKY